MNTDTEYMEFKTLQRVRAGIVLGSIFLAGNLLMWLFIYERLKAPALITFALTFGGMIGLRPYLRRPFIRSGTIRRTTGGIEMDIHSNQTEAGTEQTQFDFNDIDSYTVNISNSFPGKDYVLIWVFMKDGSRKLLNIIDENRMENGKLNPNSVLAWIITTFKIHNRALDEKIILKTILFSKGQLGQALLWLLGLLIVTGILLLFTKIHQFNTYILSSFGILLIALSVLAQRKGDMALYKELSQFTTE